MAKRKMIAVVAAGRRKAGRWFRRRDRGRGMLGGSDREEAKWNRGGV
jgi:hypothetical protein